MGSLHGLEKRRDAILENMRAIRSMRKGTINEQFLQVQHKGKDKPVSRGPYFVLSRRKQGKTVSKRLTSVEEVKQAQKDVESYKKFVALCKEFEDVTERLGEVERDRAEVEQEKKRRNSRSSKTRR